jgi:type II secretory pathway component PulJ
VSFALKRPVLVFGPVALLVVALALLTNVLPFRDIVRQRQEIAAARSYLAELEAANAQLEERIEALQTPLEIERLARERLGYVRPGEEAFVVIDPGMDDPPEAAAPTVGEEDPSWWERIWAFLTGADLTG